MRTPLAIALAVAMLSSSAAARGQQAPEPGATRAALTKFSKLIQDYAALHRRLEGPLPAMAVTNDVRKIYEAQQALADAIRAARPSAKQGDIFSDEIGLAFRQLIRNALTGCNVADVYADMTGETTAVPSKPRVNATYIWGCSGGMPVDVLQALPPLPEDLTYRFVGRDLVIVDSHANLVVDVLTDAFPPS